MYATTTIGQAALVNMGKLTHPHMNCLGSIDGRMTLLHYRRSYLTRNCWPVLLTMYVLGKLESALGQLFIHF